MALIAGRKFSSLGLLRFTAVFLAVLLPVSMPIAGQSQTPAPIAQAAKSPATKMNSPPPPGSIKASSDNVSWLSNKETALSVAVLAFGFALSVMQVAIMRSSKFRPGDVIKLFGLTFIVTAVLFIITAGYGAEQIAPAMGLFGTVAGYILGRNQGGRNEEAD